MLSRVAFHLLDEPIRRACREPGAVHRRHVQHDAGPARRIVGSSGCLWSARPETTVLSEALRAGHSRERGSILDLRHGVSQFDSVLRPPGPGERPHRTRGHLVRDVGASQSPVPPGEGGSGRSESLQSPNEFFQEVKMASHLFCGITDGTFSHGEGWQFARLGRMLERADKTSRLLDVKYFLLLPRIRMSGTPIDDLQWSAVLRASAVSRCIANATGSCPSESSDSWSSIGCFPAPSCTASTARTSRCMPSRVRPKAPSGIRPKNDWASCGASWPTDGRRDHFQGSARVPRLAASQDQRSRRRNLPHLLFRFSQGLRRAGSLM